MRLRRHGAGGVRAVMPGLLGAALLASVLGSAGCARSQSASGAGSGSAPGPQQVRGAATKLAAVGTSKVRTTMAMSSGGTRVTLDGVGEFDYADGTGRLRVALPPGSSGARPGKRRTVTEVLTPGVLYMKNRGAGVPADQWVRVGTTRVPDGNLVTAGATDPLTAAELLRGAGDIVARGSERRGGVRVWHFSGTASLTGAARRATGPAREQLLTARRGFARALVPFDAYLDARGRLREVTHRLSYGPPGRRAADAEREVTPVPVSSTVRLHGFGTPVRITPPPSSAIYPGRVTLS